MDQRIKFILNLLPCVDGKEWLESLDGYSEEAYKSCPRPDWIVWLWEQTSPRVISSGYEKWCQEICRELLALEPSEEELDQLCESHDETCECRLCILSCDLDDNSDQPLELSFLLVEAFIRAGFSDRLVEVGEVVRKFITFEKLSEAVANLNEQ